MVRKKIKSFGQEGGRYHYSTRRGDKLTNIMSQKSYAELTVEGRMSGFSPGQVITGIHVPGDVLSLL